MKLSVDAHSEYYQKVYWPAVAHITNIQYYESFSC